MKTESRLVYISNDGEREFLDKDSCLLYERQQALKEIINTHTVYGDQITDIDELINAIISWIDC